MAAETACRTCTFFDDRPDERRNGTSEGFCRVNPPATNLEAHSEAAWPAVKGEDWCGQHTLPRAERARLAA